jgi:hypothetical protein
LAILLAVICTYPPTKVLSFKALFLHIAEERLKLAGGGQDETEVGGRGAHRAGDVLGVVLHGGVEWVARQLHDLKKRILSTEL